jgi:hypothetical protein
MFRAQIPPSNGLLGEDDSQVLVRIFKARGHEKRRWCDGCSRWKWNEVFCSAISIVLVKPAWQRLAGIP